MKNRIHSFRRLLMPVVILTIAIPVIAQKKAENKKDTVTQMLDVSRPDQHHLILGALAGNWKFQDAKLSFVKGTAVRAALYEGRFYTVEITGGRLQIPVADGKWKEDNFRSQQIEGYDNGRGKYITTSINNHIGSDVQVQMGIYDSVAHAFTYYWDSELLKGYKVKSKRVLKVVDSDHYVEEYYEERNGKYSKVRELDFERVK